MQCLIYPGKLWTRLPLLAGIVAMGTLLGGLPATGQTVFISTGDSAAFDDVPAFNLLEGDVAEVSFDSQPAWKIDTALTYFSKTMFASSENVDACHYLSPYHVAVSTAGSSYIGGVSLSDGDVVEVSYTVVGDTWTVDSAAKIYDENLVSGRDTDALYVLGTGHLLLSFDSSVTLGAVTYDADDIIEIVFHGNDDDGWVLDDHSLWLDGSNVFDEAANIDGFDRIAPGHVLLSTSADESITWDGGNETLTCLEGDIVEVEFDENGTVTNAKTFFPESLFVNGEDIDAITQIPEPATLLLLAVGAAGLLRRRR